MDKSVLPPLPISDIAKGRTLADLRFAQATKRQMTFDGIPVRSHLHTSGLNPSLFCRPVTWNRTTGKCKHSVPSINPHFFHPIVTGTLKTGTSLRAGSSPTALREKLIQPMKDVVFITTSMHGLCRGIQMGSVSLPADHFVPED